MRLPRLLFPVAILFLIYALHAAANPVLRNFESTVRVPTGGVGTQQDTQKSSDALTALLKAAEQGDVKSQLELAKSYLSGIGVRQNDAEALKWLRKAADQGEAVAQTMVGLMYFKGTSVTQDYAEALKWLRKAADQGEAKAQLKLGSLYFAGRGVRKDYVQAHMWANLAAAALSGEEQETAAKVRDQIAKNMTPQQIAEAQRLASEWKPKQAK
jgi:hypothetical protein